MSALAQDWDAFHTTHEQQHDWYGPPDATKRRPLLDKPSQPNPILDYLMDEAMTRIMLVSDGAVAALKARVTGSKAGTIEPHSDLAAIVDGFDGRYLACKTHRQRMQVIKDAQDATVLLKYAPRAEQRGTREWKEAIGLDERPCRIVAAVYGVSLRDVVAYRKSYR